MPAGGALARAWRGRRPACSLGRMEAASPGLERGSTTSGRCRWRRGRGGSLTGDAEEVLSWSQRRRLQRDDAEGQCGRQQVLSGRSSLTTPWSLCQPNPSSHACSNPKLQGLHIAAQRSASRVSSSTHDSNYVVVCSGFHYFSVEFSCRFIQLISIATHRKAYILILVQFSSDFHYSNFDFGSVLVRFSLFFQLNSVAD